MRKQLNAEYKRKVREADNMHAENKRQAEEQIAGLKASKMEKKENGSFPEYSNLITSIYQSKHKRNISTND